MFDVPFNNLVYIAGPTIFHGNKNLCYEEISEELKKYELLGIRPDHGLKNNASSKDIYDNCIRWITDCDSMIVDVSSFRGSEPDSGTVFELGYAFAKGKIIVAYNNTHLDYRERVEKDELNPEGCVIEDFGNLNNLMISESVLTLRNFKEAVKALSIIHKGVRDE